VRREIGHELGQAAPRRRRIAIEFEVVGDAARTSRASPTDGDVGVEDRIADRLEKLGSPEPALIDDPALASLPEHL
jgi:uncharacterized protein with LGFP repeats